MALPGRAKDLFELGLRSSRLPLDAAMRVTGRADSRLELTVDRLEAGVRTVAGALFDDEEMRRLGTRGLNAARDREVAAKSREADPGPRVGRD